MLVPANPRSAMSAAAASTIFRRDSTPSSSRRDSFRAALRSGIPCPPEARVQPGQQRERILSLDRATGRLVETVVVREAIDAQTRHRLGGEWEIRAEEDLCRGHQLPERAQGM